MTVVKRRVLKVEGKSRVFKARQGWALVGGKNCYFRSDWEKKYANYLELLKRNGDIREWEYEPRTFWFEEIKRGTRSYLPDFKVTRPDGSHYWVEVKGYFDSKSLTKLKRFKKYYPEEQIIIAPKDFFDGQKTGQLHPSLEKKKTSLSSRFR